MLFRFNFRQILRVISLAAADPSHLREMIVTRMEFRVFCLQIFCLTSVVTTVFLGIDVHLDGD